MSIHPASAARPWWLDPSARPVPSLPPAWGGEPLAGHRAVEAWTWRLLDRDDADLGELGQVEAGDLSFDVAAETRGTGNLTWVGQADDAPSWPHVRVQPWYSAILGDGQVVSWPLGVFLPSTARTEHGTGRVVVPVQLFDKTLILRRAKTTATLGLDAGTIVHEAVRDLAAEYAGGRVVVEESAATLRSAMVWEPGTPILTIINDVLDAGGYFALYADGQGTLRSEQYREPSARPLLWGFADGAASIYRESFAHEMTWFDVPNRVTFLSRAEPDVPPLVATATNTDPTDPLSVPRLGFYVDEVQADVEAADSYILTQQAEAYLARSRRRATTLTLTHAAVPIQVNARVNFHRALSASPVALSGVVRAIRIPQTAPGALWETTLQEVRS